MKKYLVMLLAASVTMGLAACGSKPAASEPKTSEAPAESAAPETEAPQTEAAEPGKLDAIKDVMNSLAEVQVAEINAYKTDYDQMVAYLQKEGIIDVDAQAVDMNTTAGYANKYDGTKEDVVAFADKANDYNGVQLIWFDLLGGSEYASNCSALTFNDGVIPVMGGMYTISTGAYNGSYALAFAEGYDETKMAAACDALKAIENVKPSITLYTMDELAMTLQKAGIISVQEMAAPVNANEDYSFIAPGQDWVGVYDKDNNPEGTKDGYTEVYDKTFYVEQASAANRYGDVTVYFYDTNDSMLEWMPYGTTYTELKANVKEDGSSTANLYFDEKNDGNVIVYPDADLSVDYLCGPFAVVVTE